MAETVVDNIIVEKGTGTIILWLSQPDPWNSPGLMAKLQDKLNGYISIIRDGWLVQKFPQYDGSQFRISLACHDYPPEDIKMELDRVNHALLEIGIEFRIVHIQVETPQEHRAKLKKSIGSLFKRILGKGS